MVERAFSTDFFPIVVAHRGVSRDEPENTLAAFEVALAAGAEAVEMDVRATADGVPVILHDPGLPGGPAVADLTSRELSRMRGELGTGAAPELSAVLNALSGRVGLDLEVKNIPGEPGFDPEEGQLRAALDALDASAFSGPVILSSFNPRTIAASRGIRPDVPTGLLTPASVSVADALEQAEQGGHIWVLPAAAALEPAGTEFVSRAHASGLLVGTWVLDEPGDIGAAFSWGIDALATNDPTTALAVRGARR